MFENDDLPNFGNNENKASIISDSCTIVGDIITNNRLLVSGVVKGNITSTDKITINGSVTGDISGESIVLGEASLKGSILKATHVELLHKNSMIDGSINGNSCDCNGSINGNVYLKEGLALSATSSLIGDVKVGSLAMDKGALLKGKVNIEQK